MLPQAMDIKYMLYEYLTNIPVITDIFHSCICFTTFKTHLQNLHSPYILHVSLLRCIPIRNKHSTFHKVKIMIAKLDLGMAEEI